MAGYVERMRRKGACPLSDGNLISIPVRLCSLNVSLSPMTGTIFHERQEFDKVSPLAGKLNGSTLNGWEYLEVKKDGEWIKFDTLRQQLRQEDKN